MSKKKKAKKRFNKPSTSTPAAQTKATSIAATEVPAGAKTSKTAPVPSIASSAIKVDPRWGYVGRDVRRIAVLAVICVGIELVLWLLFNRTSLGSNVYQLIKL